MTRRILILATIVLIAGCDVGVSTIPETVPPNIATPAASTPASAASGPAVEATPEPSETVEASPPSVAFEDITLKGKGNKVATFTIPDGEAAIVVISHAGTSNFIVNSVNASGERIDGLVNTIGNYSGTVPFDADIDIRGEEQTVAFAIDADGAWTITIKPVAAAPAWDPATTLEGTGDQVFRVVPPSGGPSGGFVSVNLTYRGHDRFIVHAYNSDGRNGLANEMGNFTDKVGMPDSSFLLGIHAGSGSWSITPG